MKSTKLAERTPFAELPEVLTAEEVARVMRLGRNTVYEALRCGAIPSVRIGRRLLVPKAALLRLLERPEKVA